MKTQYLSNREFCKNHYCRHSISTKIRRFTLVELLVVIAIIVMLAGMLLPALKRARDTGKSISCLSKLKQIGIAQGGYHSDWNDIYPALYYGATASNLPWTEAIGAYLGMRSGPAGYAEGGIWSCPSQLVWMSKSAPYISYGYNFGALGNIDYASYSSYGKTSRFPYRASKIKNPSLQLTHVDCWFFDSTLQYRSGGRFSADQPYIGYRHSRKANILYADGHSSMATSSLLWNGIVTTYPWNIGQCDLPWAARSIASWESTYGYWPY